MFLTSAACLPPFFLSFLPSFYTRTRRAWLPNVQRKKLYSEILDQSIRLNVTPFVLRWIDRVGGLDNYLLRTSDAKLASAKAIELKNQLKQVLEERNTSGAAAAQVE